MPSKQIIGKRSGRTPFRRAAGGIRLIWAAAALAGAPVAAQPPAPTPAQVQWLRRA